MSDDRCDWCGREMPEGMRSDARFCGRRCRQAYHRAKPRRLRPSDGSALRFAYADPPYVGKARYYRDQPDYAGEVDHAVLFDRLVGYDGWALSCSADSLPGLLRIAPDGVRVGVWVRGARRTRSLRPSNAYEPVIYCGGRAVAASSRTDVLAHGYHPSLLADGLIGAKPLAFAYWLFELLGMQSGDSFDDLFPGSGSVSLAWRLYSSPHEGAKRLSTYGEIAEPFRVSSAIDVCGKARETNDCGEL